MKELKTTWYLISKALCHFGNVIWISVNTSLSAFYQVCGLSEEGKAPTLENDGILKLHDFQMNVSYPADLDWSPSVYYSNE